MDEIADLTLIEERLKKILWDKFNIDLSFWDENKVDADLLSTTVGLVPRDLIYLLYYVEKEFNIKIKDEDIINRKFSSLKNIKDIILDSYSIDEIKY